MFSSLRSRLWLTYLLIVMVVITVVGLALIVYLVRNPTESRQEIQRLRLVSLLVLERSDVSAFLANPPSPEQLQAAVERGDSTLGVRIAIQSNTGATLADSRLSTAGPLPILIAQRDLRQGELPVFKDSRGKYWLYATRTINKSSMLIVASPRPRTPIYAILRDEFFAPFGRAIALALILALIMAFWIARWIAAPLQRMSNAAHSVSGTQSLTNFQPIPLEGPREVQTLAQAFNDMASRVKSSQQSQRDFVANVSHELKTPLTSIQGFAQALIDGTADNPEAMRSAAQVISSEAERMHRLVLDLLDLARMDAGTVTFERQEVDLSLLLREVAEKFTPLARKSQIDLQVQVEPHLQVLGDSDRLSQVFMNLVDNALKFTPSNGVIQLRAYAVDRQNVISVTDSGPGIPAGELDRIFERFYQIDKSRRGGNRRGAGLGLAIAREIVQMHDGTILASNNSGQGAVFVVKLPCMRPTEPAINRRQTG